MGNLITYAYFIRIWKNKFNDVHIPKKSKMVVRNTCIFLKEKRKKTEGVKEGLSLHNYFL